MMPPATSSGPMGGFQRNDIPDFDFIPSTNRTMALATPLRRAMYATVESLVQPFAIDPEKLKKEMEKFDSKGKNQDESLPSSPEVQLVVEVEEEAGSDDKPSQKQQQPKLAPPAGGYNLCLLVGRVNVVVDKSRVDGSRMRLAEVEVGDETGIASLRARDDQIDLLQEISTKSGAVVLRNCTMELYQGKHLRLAVTKWGKLSAYPDSVASTPNPPLQMKKELNYSSVDLNLVIVEISSDPAEGFALPLDSQHRELSGSDVSFGENLGSQRSTGGQRRGSQNRKQNTYHRRQGPNGATAHNRRVMQYPGHSLEAPIDPMMTYGSFYDDGHSAKQHFQQIYRMPRDHHQKQHQLLLQQYDVQQRHFEQMHMFQRQSHLYEPHLQRDLQPIHHHTGSLLSHTQSPQVENENHSGNPKPDPAIQSDAVVQTSSTAAPLQHRLQRREESASQTDPDVRSGVSPHDNETPYHVDNRTASASDEMGSQVESVACGVASLATSQDPQPMGGSNQASSWSHSSLNVFGPKSETPPSLGLMNPQATSFAPSYNKSRDTTHQAQTAYSFSHYNPPQGNITSTYESSSVTHQHQMYPQGTLCIPPGRSLQQTTSGYHNPQNAMQPNPAQFVAYHRSVPTNRRTKRHGTTKSKRAPDDRGRKNH